MKALILKPVWATLTLFGEKKVECRTWQTDFRGEILISSGRYTGLDCKGLPVSCACAVARLDDIVPFGEEHLKSACLKATMVPEHAWAWIWGAIRPVKPFRISGRQGLFDVKTEVEYLPSDIVSDEKSLEKVFEPFIYL